MPSHPPKPLLLALAGPTSSGKTTIATALSLIFAPSLSSSSSPSDNPQTQSLATNPFTIIHADDFYLPDTQIPVLESGVQDWDCPEALDLTRFLAVLRTVRDGGEVPWDLVRQGGLEDGERGGGGVGGKEAAQDLNSGKEKTEGAEGELDGIHGVPTSPISPAKIASLRHKISHWPPLAKARRIVLVEGILLFSSRAPLSTLTDLFDVRVLLRTTRAAAKMRREARAGYVTLEGFWQDPPGYFDDVVWPGFVKAYGGLFMGGDVEGVPSRDQVEELGVEVGPLLGDGNQRGGEERASMELESLLGWIVDVLEGALGSPRVI